MFSSDTRPERRKDRPRRRPSRVAVEGLETRQLMAYSPFGYSLPQLSVTGYAATAAAWGSNLAVDVTVENQGAATLIEPTHLTPGSASDADSTATTVQVFASAKPNANTGLVKIDTIDIPGIQQNGQYQTNSYIALPSKPAGFPGVGGKIYLTFVVNNDQSILQITNADNIYRDPTSVRITNALPDLQVVGFDIPSTLQPGDVVTPTIRIANLGTANPAAQGPVLVEIIASVNDTFGPGDSVVAKFTINSLPGTAGVPTMGSIANDANVTLTPNEIDIAVPALKLPTSPSNYYLGIKIDPFHAINQTYGASPALSDVIHVGPRNPLLPPAELLAVTDGKVPIFPASPASIANPVSSTAPAYPDLFPLTASSVISPSLVNPGGPVVALSLKATKHPKVTKKA